MKKKSLRALFTKTFFTIIDKYNKFQYVIFGLII